ncbi:hypothetical protein ACIBD9_08105 [Micromonospora sp. NPDC050784]|uniref:hypothetical protein n=1 Tax=Micromonospora sp. NPDC050784 TaxID=3364281 RepID=UPI0037957997
MNRYVYPRLPLAIARARVAEIAEAWTTGGLEAVAVLSDVLHPHAAPVATGGRVRDPDQIADVRRAVCERLKPWLADGEVPRRDSAAYDLQLGRVLHQELDILPADAAHAGTWSFLSLVVLPDVAVVRFPTLHVDRLIGTPRNALRRTWMREDVLGDLMHSSDRPLGEDELVGLFERTSLARNRRLIRRLAVAVQAYDGTTARSQWARDLYVGVTYATGPRILDALSDSELDGLIVDAAERAGQA